MFTFANRMRLISRLEGFDFVIKDSNGNLIDPCMKNLPAYPHEKPAKSSTTVEEWKKRFLTEYPMFNDNSCFELLSGNGSVVFENHTLGYVRSTYEEE